MDNISGMQIGSALLMLMMIGFMWPNAKHWLKNGPKAGEGDWKAVLIPIAAVVAFVVLLMSSV